MDWGGRGWKSPHKVVENGAVSVAPRSNDAVLLLPPRRRASPPPLLMSAPAAAPSPEDASDERPESARSQRLGISGYWQLFREGCARAEPPLGTRR